MSAISTTASLASALLLATSLAACTSITVEPLSVELQVTTVHIQENPKVLVDDFVQVVQDGLTRHGISSTTFTTTKPAGDQFVLTYTARRSWDIGTYLATAEIWIMHDGEQVGYGEYHLIGGGGLSLAKWDGTASKINPLLDELLEQYSQTEP